MKYELSTANEDEDNLQARPATEYKTNAMYPFTVELAPLVEALPVAELLEFVYLINSGKLTRRKIHTQRQPRGEPAIKEFSDIDYTS